MLRVRPSLLHRLFYPQVPAILSASHRGKISAMPVVSYASVSDAPPLVAVACNPSSFTCKLALRARSFSLSLVDRAHLGAMERLATTSGSSAADKLADAGLHHRRGAASHVPVVAEAQATLECKLNSKHKLGDHLLLVGLVEAAYTSKAFSDFWDFHRYKPILYTGWREGMSTYEGP